MKHISKLIDLTGQKFGRLKVIRKDKTQQRTKWWCKCDCGNPKEILVYGQNLKKGFTTSCGCVQREMLIKRNKKYNDFIEKENYYIGYDSHNNSFKFDKEDFQIVSKYNWFKTSNGYFQAIIPNSNRKHISLHRLIMNVSDSEIDIDHINHDKSDNRKENLRIVTAQENSCNMRLSITNTSGVKGVVWNNKKHKWQARAMKNYKNFHLGYYNDFDDAVTARKNWEIEMQKDYRYKEEEDVINIGK